MPKLPKSTIRFELNYRKDPLLKIRYDALPSKLNVIFGARRIKLNVHLINEHDEPVPAGELELEVALKHRLLDY